MKKYTLAFNSTLIFISTFLIATIIHELGHFIVSTMYGLHPVLHHNYVSHNAALSTPLQKVIIAAAGPLLSLVTGILFLYIDIKWIKPSIAKLFMLWLGLNSLLTFLGYMLIAPFVKAGDTGKVFDYLGIPLGWGISITVIFAFIIMVVMVKIAYQFTYYKSQPVFNQKANALQLFVIPIFVSIVALTLLNLPVIIWASLLPTLFMPCSYFSTMGRYKSMSLSDAPVLINKISIPITIITVCTSILFRSLV